VRRAPPSWRAAVGGVALALWGAGCFEPASTPAAPTQAEPGYVGSAACAECHAREAAAFEGSHHDLAMEAASPDTLLGDFAYARAAAASTSPRFLREGNRFRVEARGADGASVTREVAWAFGVEPLQQLLLPAPGGRLQAFGWAWDARSAEAGGQRWFALFPEAAPGDPLHWTGYEQTANHQCIECHTTNYRKAYDRERDAYASEWSEAGVGCEACHGPASAHVVRAREGRAKDGDSGLVADLAGAGSWRFAEGAAIARRALPGPPSRAEADLCARCHARRERFADGDRPDRPLLDAHRPALLEPHLYHADGQPRDEVYVWGSFLQSRMAAAGVTCSDCHEPHSLQTRAEGNALCSSCHSAAVYDTPEHHRHAPGSEAALCASCHMPTQVFMGVDARREHAFRVPRPDRAEALDAPDVCTGCHAQRDPDWAARAIEAWHGPERPPTWHFPEALASARAARPDAAAKLMALLGGAEEPAIARATAARELGALLDASTVRALERALGDPDPLVRMAAAETAAGLPPPLRAEWLAGLLGDRQRAVRLAAARSLTGVPDEMLGARDRARLARAQAELRAAAARNADRPEARLALAQLHAQRGELDAALREAEDALVLDPAFVPAAVNLADLLRAQGHDEAGGAVLREALALTPQSPELHHALGLLQVRRGRRDEAMDSLSRAAELAGDGRYAYPLGLLLVEEGRVAEGLRALEEALASRPGDRDLLVALATLHRDRGDREAAVGYARRLVETSPGDPRAASLLDALSGPSPR